MTPSTTARSPVATMAAAAGGACYAIVAVALCVPVVPFGADGYRSGTTMYPVWIWMLVLAGLVAAIASLRSPRNVRAAAGAVALVAAMPLVGTGIVAYRHWKPAFGMGGGYGHGYESLETLKAMAILVAVSALLAGVAAAVQLVSVSALPAHLPATLRWASVLAGLAVIAGLPLAIGAGGYGEGDLTSVGAAGLIYAGPWGAACIVSGWLARPAAIGALGAVCGCISLAVIGPQMTDLLWPNPTLPFALCLVPPLALLLARLATTSSHAPVDRSAAPAGLVDGQ